MSSSGPRSWQRVAARRLLETRIFGIDHQRLLSPRTGAEHDIYVLDCPDWCNIVPLTDDGQVVMVRQHRHGTGEVTLELPGGMVDPEDPSPLLAAARELFEETGYEAATIEPIGVIAPNPAILSNRCHSFLARGVRRVAEMALDPGEDIEVVTVPYGDIPALVARGEISHALVVVAFAFALGLRAP
ncbi:MAG TPA: NUDIX hydrolase [Polyangia bacterium]|jgi:8-oxo-dGTP pyrophosphatase MutT (NUDIX family)|nr:NUDIX hydrolase [Polyangia bacterium]